MAETSMSKGKKKKALYIGLGILALGGLIWFIMRRKNVTINIENYKISDYAPLTDNQLQGKIKTAQEEINNLGVDDAIKGFQNQIDSLMAGGTPEGLATAKLLQDIIADLQNQTKMGTDITAPITSSMGMGSGVPTLTASSVDATKYPLIDSSMIPGFINDINALISRDGLQTTIDNMNKNVNELFNRNTPRDVQEGLLINDIIRALGGTPLYSPKQVTTLSTNPTPTPTMNDVNTFVDPPSIPLTGIAPTPSGTTMLTTTPTRPQLSSTLFDTANYPNVTQALIDDKVAQINASVLANGVGATVQSLLANATQLDASSNPADRDVAKLIYDMAATLDIINNPANASKYVIKDANYWRDFLINLFKLSTATPNNSGLKQWLYVKWAKHGIDFPEPIQSQYIAQPNAGVKTRFIDSLIVQNGGLNIVNSLTFNLSPLGKIIQYYPAR
jgi:hypothetical protein